MSLSNPSHILIARSSRVPVWNSHLNADSARTHSSGLPTLPQHATLSTPEAHAGSTHRAPRNSSSPPTMTILASDESENDDESTGPIDYHEPNDLTADTVDPTFQEDNEFPGTVKIIVQDTTFWFYSPSLFTCDAGADCVLLAAGHTRSCFILLLRSSRRHLVEGEQLIREHTSQFLRIVTSKMVGNH